MPLLEPGAGLGASYRLSRPIGSGAVGDVWLVESPTEGTSYAAKILKAEHANDSGLVERFIRERSVLLGLRHPSIVAVRDLVVEGSTIAIVMDYVPGGSLRDLIAAEPTLPAGEAFTLMSQVFTALAEAHTSGVTHRDIKPDNVLLSEPWRPGQSGTVRVADFGIASVVSDRPRQTTGLLGTPQYMAPELISDGRTTSAADVYSTAVMLYELLSGRTPFAGPGTDFTVAYRHVTTKPPGLDLPSPITDWIERLLAKHPGERPSAAEAAAHARELAARFSDLPPLPLSELVEFQEVERPATVLRGALMPDAGTEPEYVSPLSQDAPELGEAGQRTTLRPMPRRDPGAAPAAAPAPRTRSRDWLSRKTILLASAGVLLLAGLGVGLVWLFGSGSPTAEPASAEALEAAQQDPALPTGLSVSRQASYLPEAKQILVEFRYTAQKAPLSGALLEVLPAVDDGAACPPAVWEGVEATRHQARTGLDAACGWKLAGVEIPAGGEFTVTTSIPATVGDLDALRRWLSDASSQTSAALSDPESNSTAYPVQRLMDLTVVVPPRTVSQTTLPITLVPVWPGGPDEFGPVYQSPATGTPTQLLESVAGGEAGVRFSDSCSGAVAISPDGLTVTTLSPTTGCRIHASVGNFTNLESTPFSITTRE